MKIKIKQAELANIIQACAAITDEASFEVDSERLAFRGMEPGHISMCDILYPKSAFDEFEIEQPQRFGVRVDEIVKVLKRFEKNALIGLGLTQDSKIIISDQTKFYHLALIESAVSSTPLPKLTFTATIEASHEAIVKAFGDVYAISTYVQMIAQSGELTLKGFGDTGEATTSPEATVSGEAKATYSLDFLIKMLAAVKAGKVKLEYADKMPLKLSFDDGKITYFLAPRISD